MKIRVQGPYNVVRLGWLVLGGIVGGIREGDIRLASFGPVFELEISRIMARAAGWRWIVQAVYVRLLYYGKEGKLGCMGDNRDC